MDKKELRHQRRKGFFIEAAKKVLKTGDETMINAKEIASIAGYSASSIYDYFSNLDELLMKSVDEFMVEINILMVKEIKKQKLMTDQIKAPFLVYANYFLENPLLFKTIFMSGNSRARFSTDISLMPKFYKMGSDRLNFLIKYEKELSLEKDTGASIERILTPNMFGMLYMYFFGIYEYSPEELLKIMESNIDKVLNPYKKIEMKKMNKNEENLEGEKWKILKKGLINRF